MGTINYYSPELLGYIQQAGVAASQLGVASDLFALGLIYTEYLTGRRPRSTSRPTTNQRYPCAVARRFASPAPILTRPSLT